MPKKPLSPERKASAQVKRLGITLAELKIEIDAADGDLKRVIRLNRNDYIRLIIRCKHATIPQSWAMAMLQHNVCIDCIDFHVTDYLDAEGIRRLGWHRDLRENGRTISKICLHNFRPETLEQFILEGLALFKVILKPRRERRCQRPNANPLKNPS